MKRFNLAFATLFALTLGQAAHAADIPARMLTKAPAAVVGFSWTGLYIGGHVGGGWNRNAWTDVGVGALIGANTASGVLAGGQLGYNHQVGAWVFGIELDASWADLTGQHQDPIFSLIAPTGLEQHHIRTDFIGTATARIGYAWDRTLFYVKGGAAWVHNKYHSTDFFARGQTFATSEDQRTGWTVGAGLEYAFAPNWSAKVEYNYIDVGSDRLLMACGAIAGCVSFRVDIDQQIHVAKFGINYRFGPGGN